ncbi:MAG: EamA family transporter [Homoserinimonas sp.]
MLTLLVVVVGLGGALIYGAADFFGGLASRSISTIRVTAIGVISGLVVLVLALPVVGGQWSTQAALFGGLSGVVGAGAIVLLYACLSLGPMSILSPLTAVVSAIVPMTAGLIRGERLDPLGYLALVLALVAVVLVGFVPARTALRPTLKALTMATGAGTLIGAFLILIDMTPDNSGLVPLIVNRVVSGAVMFTAIGLIALVAARNRRLLRRFPSVDDSAALRDGPRTTPWLPALKLAVLAGALDAVANALILSGLRLGELTIMSVLVAMYSAGTIILAAVVLKERLTASQVFGLILALSAAAMLAVV